MTIEVRADAEAQLKTETTWWKSLRRLASGDTAARGAVAHVFLEPSGIAEEEEKDGDCC
jgi:hypothetical protein